METGDRETLLQRERDREGRARALSSVIELRYRSSSSSSSKSERLRARRRPVSVDDLELLKIIGRGAFGEVRLCRERASRRVYAMKTMRKSQLVEQGEVAHVWAERVAMAEASDSGGGGARARPLSPAHSGECGGSGAGGRGGGAAQEWLVQLHHAWCSASTSTS